MNGLYSDFLIIGAGGIGLATALELAKTGAKITLIDRQCVGREASWAGGGILFPLLPWHYAEVVTTLASYSQTLYPAWSQLLHETSDIDPEYQACGMLVLPPFDTEAALDWCSAHQMPFEYPPLLQPPLESFHDEALWLPQVAQVRNPRLLQALRHTVEQQQVNIVEHAEFLHWEIRNGKITGILTTAGHHHAANYIVTSGAWSPLLLQKLGSTPQLYPVRGQMLLFQGEPNWLNTILFHQGVYIIPRQDGHILVGSTLEEVGFDKNTTETARALLHKHALKLLPQLASAPLVQHWAGLRPGSIRNIPTIDRHPQFENLFLNSGHYRYGVTMAPASAELLCCLMAGQEHPTLQTHDYRWREIPAEPSTH